ncbi:GHKL domain-containing protein [Anaerorhabdus furcosa]|uniref:GHKL domain-containing protein n=1 Tax=Anaerorhabdus furcosa TaxID=118967 RepID=A0A1T4K2T0_9FIRM|nr:GHKL domain-containing protein [Anaerorhabdus furcosa]SJZ36741.1 GHKL domain-containing protein [Anaerorhabdus furcosa]
MNYIIDTTIYLSFLFIMFRKKDKTHLTISILFSLIFLAFLFKISIFELNFKNVTFIILIYAIIINLSDESDFEIFYTMVLYLVLGNLMSQIVTYSYYNLQTTYKNLLIYLLNNYANIFIISRIFILLTYLLLAHFRNKHKIKFSLLEILPLLIISGTLLFICVLLSKMLFGQWILSIDILIIDIFILLIVIIVNILYHYLVQHKERINEVEFEKIILQNKIITQKRICELNDEIIHFRHDIKHSFRYIEDLLQIGDISTALSIVKKQHELPVLNSHYVITQCPLFDLIINDYKDKSIVEKFDFKTTANITSDVNIDALKFNSILCNCLDNAFENCGVEGFIELSAVINDSSININITNSIAKNIFPIQKDKKFHGKGINNIRSNINSLNGNFNIILDSLAYTSISIPNYPSK